jgi:polyketide cyclase/dehydrase/lipid transport protein
MLKKSLLAVPVAAGLFAAFVATRPAEHTVVRSVTVFAPAAVAYGHVASFHRWAAWSPWGALDARSAEFGGPAAGLGATYRWRGSERLAEGLMRIIEARPASELVVSIASEKRLGQDSTLTFAFAPDGPGTRVSLEMAEKLSFVGKALHAFDRHDPDRTLGPDFEAGLSALKGIAECEAFEAGVGDGVREGVPAGALSAVIAQPAK